MINPRNECLPGKGEEEGYSWMFCLNECFCVCWGSWTWWNLWEKLHGICTHIRICSILHNSPTVRASKSLCMVPWSFTMPDSWMHFTNSSSCMYFFGSWKRFTAPSSCPLSWRARSRSWSLLRRLMSRFSSGRLSACGEILSFTTTVLINMVIMASFAGWYWMSWPVTVQPLEVTQLET